MDTEQLIFQNVVQGLAFFQQYAGTLNSSLSSTAAHITKRKDTFFHAYLIRVQLKQLTFVQQTYTSATWLDMFKKGQGFSIRNTKQPVLVQFWIQFLSIYIVLESQVWTLLISYANAFMNDEKTAVWTEAPSVTEVLWGFVQVSRTAPVETLITHSRNSLMHA